MPGFLYPFAVTLGGILGMLGLWLTVQRLWGRTFAIDGDVLAARADCGGCAHADHCTAADLCAAGDTGALRIDTSAGAAGPIDTTVAFGDPTPRDKAG